MANHYKEHLCQIQLPADGSCYSLLLFEGFYFFFLIRIQLIYIYIFKFFNQFTSVLYHFFTYLRFFFINAQEKIADFKIAHKSNSTKYSVVRENEINCISIPVITRTHQNVCFYQLQISSYVSQNIIIPHHLLCLSLYILTKERLQKYFLCTSKFLICLAAKVCLF